MTAQIQTDEFWDGSADQYIASAEPFTAQFCNNAAMLAEISPGMTLLDVATGPGALAISAAKAGASVTAIDFSQAMIDRLSTRIGDLPIVARRMDGQALDLPDATFDRACSVFGIPLFPDWRAGFRELVRVLRPGGKAVIAVADNPHGFGPNPLLAQARVAHTGTAAPVEVDAMNVFADPARLANEMRDAGFDAIRFHERTHDFPLDPALLSKDHPMITQNPVLTGLSAAERAAIIHAASEIAHSKLKNGVAYLPGTARIAIGTKP